MSKLYIVLLCNRGDWVNLAVNWRAESVCKNCNDLGDILTGFRRVWKNTETITVKCT